MGEKYEKQVYLAMLAEQCSRYEDMMSFLEDMVKTKTEDLSSDERNLLSIAYKNTISLDRQAIRTLLAYESKEAKKAESPYLEYIREYKTKVQKELEDLCNKINQTIDSSLLPKATTDEAKVFYHKMKGDYDRYIAENVDGDIKKKYSDLGLAAYNAALEAAKSIDYKNPIKLGLALNLSVFYYEVVGNKEQACKLAQETLDKSREALTGADEEEDEVKDAMSIVNLLQENLSMWNSETDDA
jgi:14-3-3 protein epsilon